MATKAQMSDLGSKLAARTAKSNGTSYPAAAEIAAWSDDEFVKRATEALELVKETPGAKSQLTKYIQRLEADHKRRNG